MKKTKKWIILIILIVLMSLIFFLIFNSDDVNYIERVEDDIKTKIHLNVNDCLIKKSDIVGSSFHGDEKIFIVYNCSDSPIDFTYKSGNLKKFPLSEYLKRFVYGDSEGNTSSLSKTYDIPNIENGYYYFEDRFDNKKISSNDNKFLNRSSFNFTLIMYDVDNNFLYYYKCDT